jgi:hypothetical protein
MSRLLVVKKQTGWYYKLSDVLFYNESQFETMLLQHVRAIFEDFLTIPFKREIKSDTGVIKKPDLALIRNDFKEWWIVEVELADHSIDIVKQQVNVFLNGDYSDYDGLVDYMVKQIRVHHQSRKISNARIKRLVKNIVPSVLVIVDSRKEDWEREFRTMNVNVCVMEIYRHNRNRYSYRLAGNYPYIVSKESPCRFERRLINTLQVIEASILDGKKENEEIDISYDGELTKWIVVRDRKKVYLKYIRAGIPLTPTNTFILKMSTRNKFFLERC